MIWPPHFVNRTTRNDGNDKKPAISETKLPLGKKTENEELKKERTITYNTPQGIVQGTVLFVHYMNDFLLNKIRRESVLVCRWYCGNYDEVKVKTVSSKNGLIETC